MSEKALETAIATFAIQDVFLLSSRTSLAREFNPMQPQFTFSVQIRHCVEQECLIQERITQPDGQRIMVARQFVDTGCRIIDATESPSESAGDEVSPRVIAEVDATFAADYQVTTGQQPEPEVLRAFSENVLFHVWPYWREFVQASMTRMRVPPIVIPMFKRKRPQ